MRIIGKDRSYVIGAHAEGGRIAKVEHRALAFLTGRPVADVVAWATRWGIEVELSDDERAQVARHAEQAVAADH